MATATHHPQIWIETVDFAGIGIHIGIGTIFAAIDEERPRSLPL